VDRAKAEADSIFCDALELASPAERAAYLERACGSDPELRRRVERLLEAHAEAGGFLAAPPSVAATCDWPAEAAGTLVGLYRLLEQVGEGGMGTVYLAEQTEPIRRQVALKVIKPGMDTRQVIARFEAERQALALMDHPNIAKVFDGGETASGRPYFVMELVQGVPITRYCDEHRLAPRERLGLFVSVCQAVQHAHQKGVIHRDLKPSNVLVALYDGRPVPKVIDFGVAKATGPKLTERTLFTASGAVVGTPPYMSPEQAGLSGLDVDTRSDVYSLGALLYELLTGTAPFDKARLREAGYDEALRIIREEEPPRPSARVSAPGPATTAGAQGKEGPRKLSQLLRGELDWVVMKALEKDRNRRYESASAFAADVQRYLADEPVQACPPSAWYRFRKLARRYRTALAMAVLIVLFIALLGGGAGWAVRDRAARQARAANELELALDRWELFQGQGKRAEALAALDRAELLAGQVPADPGRDARLAALKERLAAAARDQQFSDRYEEIRLRVQSQVDVVQSRFTEEAAYPEIRDALHRYGIAIGVTAPAQVATLVQGRPEPARRGLVAALDECLRWAPQGEVQTRQWLLAALEAADTDRWRVQARQATADRDWTALEGRAREPPVSKQPPSFLIFVARALPAPMKATRLDLLRRTQRAHPADLWANHWLAVELRENGRPAEAVRYYTAALALRPDNPGIYLNRGNALREAVEVDAAIADYRQSLALAPGYAEAHTGLGAALAEKDRLDEAIAEYRQAIRLKKDLATAYYNLGNALYRKGRLDEAVAEFREAIRLEKDFAQARNNLGLALADKGLLDEAVAECRQALRLRKDYPKAHNDLGSALYRKGQLDEAIAEYREAIRLKTDYPEAHYNLGVALHDKGRLDDAIAEYREAIRLKTDFPRAHNNLGFALYRKGLLDEAIAECRQALRLKEDYPEAHYNLGNALRAKGQLEGAIAEYREVIRLKEDFAEAHCNLAGALRQQGEFREALAELRRGHELGSRSPRWRYPSAEWVRQGERLVELDEQLPAFLAGKTRPAGPAERIELAGLCSLKRFHRAAARFYEEAFAAQPRLAEALGAGHRYNAACAAALAGCGRGQDADQLDGEQRARLRRQALDWLRDDLVAWCRLLDQGPDEARRNVGAKMRHWQTDTDFAGVRGPQALAQLPEAERQAWQKLWDDVADTLARSQGKATPKK
jgi:serine/threonine protein kinase/Flp pilus assembly protein TadD